MRQDILASRRSYFTFVVFAALVMLVFVPLSTRVSAPAVLQPDLFARLYPQEPGRIEAVKVKRGQEVKQGDVLFEIASPANAQNRKLAGIEIALAELRLARIGADAQDLSESGTIQRQLASLQAQREGLEERDRRLIVRAPFAGRVADVNSSIEPGLWVGTSQQLAYLEGGGAMAVRGYVGGDDRARIEETAPAIFIPNDLTRSRIPVQLEAISAYGVTRVDLPELSSVHGGPIAVYEHANHMLAPVTAQYAIRGEVAGEAEPVNQTVRGTLLIDARPESLASRLWRWVGRVFVREFGV
jgi:putative peptide zinc metalloprotease protein